MTPKTWRLRAWVLVGISWMLAARVQAQERQVSLDALLAHAEDHAPQMIEARARLSEGEAARTGASPLLRDGLQVAFGIGPRLQEVQSAGPNDWDLQFNMTQPIEVASERGARLDAADRLSEQRESELEAVRWDVHRQIHLAYHQALQRRARIAAADRWIEQASEVLRIATSRSQVGEGADIERVIAQAELARAQQQRLGARSDFQAAILLLAEVTGWDPSDPPVPTGELDAPDALPDDASLVAMAMEHQPLIAAAAAAAATARADVTREDREAFPTLDIGLSVAREGAAGSPANWIALGWLGVTLPFWDQNTQARAEASAAQTVAEADEAALRSRLRARVLGFAAQVRLLAERLRTYQQEVMPGFDASVAGLTQAYQIGEIDLATLSAGRQTLLSMQIESLEAYTEYHTALAELEMVLGAEIDLHESASARSEASPSTSSSSGGDE